MTDTATTQTDPGLAARIQDCYAALPAAERKLADLVLDFPGDVAAYSATELADLAGVSKAAVTRFVQRLGYPGFEAARRAAREARTWGSPLYRLHHGSEPAGGFDRERHLACELANLQNTFDGLDPAEFKEIVEALATARRVWLLGYRNSHFLAAYARWQFIQVRDQVQLLPQAGETLAEQMIDMGPDDILVVIGFRRRPPQIEAAMTAAAVAEVPILCLADPAAAGIGRTAKWILRCAVTAAGAFDSYAAAISLLHFLSLELVAKTGAAGRRRLKTIEDMHQTLAELG